MKPTLLVLAAGIGSRYGGLKQIDPVGPCGEIIIDYSVFDAVRAGFGKVVFIIRTEIEKSFKESISSKYEGIINIEYAFQELNDLPAGYQVPEKRLKPWGTGHAIMSAEKCIDGPFAVINADDFYGHSAFKSLSEHLQSAVLDGPVADFSMVGFVLRNTLSDHGTVSRGVCESDNDGYLRKVTELTKIEKTEATARNLNSDGTYTDLSGDEIASMNMWGFTPVVFKHLHKQFVEFLNAHIAEEKSEFFIPSVVDRLIKEGKARVKVMKSTDSWFGITYKDDKERVIKSIKSLVDKGEYPEKLF